MFVKILSQLSPDEKQLLEANSSKQLMPKGRYLLEEGILQTHVYYLKTGLLVMEKNYTSNLNK